MNDHALTSWPQQLGLVATPLFGRERSDPNKSHLALLDGVRASFLLSTDLDLDFSAPSDWAWSSNVRHHVLLNKTQIVISRNSGSKETFERRSVESKLDEFLKYLELDSDSPNIIGAIDHLVRLFRKHRATLLEQRNKITPLDSFLYLLALSESLDFVDLYVNGVSFAEKYCLTGFDPESLTNDYVNRFLEELRYSSTSTRKLLTSLTVRHAGGALFQEAHAEVLSEPSQMTLFGLVSPGRQKLDLTALGVYYTPPGLARTLTEIAVAPHLHREEIHISDPACGSGIFLCEAIRALQRQNYAGRIYLYGCDVSLPAIQMARFSVASAVLDWPNNKVKQNIEAKSFFESLNETRQFDVVLMNPPFRSWEAMSGNDRSLVKAALGNEFAGKPDFSFAFIQESLKRLAEGGTLATLLPRGVLDSHSGRAWRESTLAQSDVRFIGTFSDHGLFRHAMVSIGAAIFERRRTGAATVMVWADERPNSAEGALRALRKRLSGSNEIEDRSESWSIYSVKPGDLSQRKSWLPTPNALGTLLDVIKGRNFSQVGELFTIRQGIKTGMNEAFLLSDVELLEIPSKERKYFRKVTNGDDIRDGRIYSATNMFYAPRVFSSIDQLVDALPIFGRRLLAHEAALRRRKSNADPEIWWEAARPRPDLAARTPRILTKRFGTLNMSAPDEKGEFMPLQAFAWMPHFEAMNVIRGLEGAALWWYCRVLNSRIFFLLRREYAAAITSGGQLAVDHKYIRDVPIPIPDRDELIKLAATIEPDVGASEKNDQIVAAQYGTEFLSWPLYEAY